MNDAVETLLASRFLEVKVVAVSYPAPAVKRVRFEGYCEAMHYYIGYAVAFRVTALDHRNYTPVMVDDDTFEIVFHLHGKGPGSLFASRLEVGNTVRMLMPRGRRMFRPAAAHFVFGDETSLGLIQAIRQEAATQQQAFAGLLELDPGNEDAAGMLQLPHIAKGNPAAMASALDAHFAGGAVAGECMYYLTGNARSIQACRKLLRERGVDNGRILTQPYWVEGKRGL